mmetsp:Transcript_128404/g.273830  ORF Transcript_128404/g.273830 Transcript_128404/m.273830 type:complete len:395 (-) Transcript_128404:2502-3686(-)
MHDNLRLYHLRLRRHALIRLSRHGYHPFDGLGPCSFRLQADLRSGSKHGACCSLSLTSHLPNRFLSRLICRNLIRLNHLLGRLHSRLLNRILNRLFSRLLRRLLSRLLGRLLCRLLSRLLNCLLNRPFSHLLSFLSRLSHPSRLRRLGALRTPSALTNLSSHLSGTGTGVLVESPVGLADSLLDRVIGHEAPDMDGLLLAWPTHAADGLTLIARRQRSRLCHHWMQKDDVVGAGERHSRGRFLQGEEQDLGLGGGFTTCATSDALELVQSLLPLAEGAAEAQARHAAVCQRSLHLSQEALPLHKDDDLGFWVVLTNGPHTAHDSTDLAAMLPVPLICGFLFQGKTGDIDLILARPQLLTAAGALAVRGANNLAEATLTIEMATTGEAQSILGHV